MQKENGPHTGRLIANRYEVKELLGDGGLGYVYKAFDTSLKRWVALKMLRETDPDFFLRFWEEAIGQGVLNHPCICQVYDSQEPDGETPAFIAMEYIDGVTLHDFMCDAWEEGYTSNIQDELIRIVVDVCAAIEYAHNMQLPESQERGVLHRDLKPDNIMLVKIGDRYLPKVLDFGLCRIGGGSGYTSDSRVFGTPIYASPEQLLYPTKTDLRGDVFSIGMILYYILSEENFYAEEEDISPFRIPSYFQQNRERRLSLIENGLERDIVGKAIEYDPDSRYQSVGELGDELSILLKRRGAKHLDITGEMEQEDFEILSQDSVPPSGRRKRKPTSPHPVPSIPPVLGPPPRRKKNELLDLEEEESDSSGKRPWIIGFSLVGIALAVMSVLIYFLLSGGDKKADSNTVKHTRKTALDSGAPAMGKKPVSPMQRTSMRITGTTPMKPVMKVEVKTPKVDAGLSQGMKSESKDAGAPKAPKRITAKELFERESTWCKKHHKWREHFKTTPTHHSGCIRSRARTYILKTRKWYLSKEIVNLLNTNFCTGFNLQNDSSMPQECKYIHQFGRVMEHGEKVDKCQKELDGILSSGSTDESSLSYKCRRMRWYIKPPPKIPAWCIRKWKSVGARGLPRKCRPIFKKYPALVPK